VAPLLADCTVVVNATPAPLEALPFHPRDLPATAIVVDLRYRPRPVDLVSAARAAGLRAGDGLEMLLHQGMLSFRRWTGLEPPWNAARAALAEAVAE
jgi:shikimate dehydrogenase